jgi:hypothetical protein
MRKRLRATIPVQAVCDGQTMVGKTIQAVRFEGEATMTQCTVTCTDGTWLVLTATTDAGDSPVLQVEGGGDDDA